MKASRIGIFVLSLVSVLSMNSASAALYCGVANGIGAAPPSVLAEEDLRPLRTVDVDVLAPATSSSPSIQLEVRDHYGDDEASERIRAVWVNGFSPRIIGGVKVGIYEDTKGRLFEISEGANGEVILKAGNWEYGCEDSAK